MPTGGHGEGLHGRTYIIRAPPMTQQARKKECNSRPCQSPSGLAALSVILLSRLQEAYGERLHLHLLRPSWAVSKVTRARAPKCVVGLVPISPNTTPSAPINRAASAGSEALASVEATGAAPSPAVQSFTTFLMQLQRREISGSKSTNCIGLGVPNRRFLSGLNTWKEGRVPNHRDGHVFTPPVGFDDILNAVGASLRRFEFGSWRA